MCKCVINRGTIFIDYGLAAFSIRFANRILNRRDSLLAREQTTQRKETCLHDGIDAGTHAGFPCHLVSIDDVKLKLFVNDGFLRRFWQLAPYLFRTEGRIEQKRSAWLSAAQNVKPLKELKLVAGHKAGRTNQIRRPDRARTKAQVGNRDGPSLFGIVDEVGLRIIIRALAD